VISNVAAFVHRQGRIRAHRHCDLFGLSLSWELVPRWLLDFLERPDIPLWSSERGERDPLVFGGGPVLTANPEPLAPFFDVAAAAGTGELPLPAFIDAVRPTGERPGPERLRSPGGGAGRLCAERSMPHPLSSDGQLLGVEADRQRQCPARVAQADLARQQPFSHSMVITPIERPGPRSTWWKWVRSWPGALRFCWPALLTLRSAPPRP